ncbi:ATP-dependent protease [Ktedonobacteria bacterium brp13]|nr:ATP-dependent protease [Ktedonobacteria bacterium brp13]
MISEIELPLFPLNVVLFPGTVLPLHIFESRYRQMIVDCQEEEKPFGVVLAKAGSQLLLEETHPVGTVAEIHNLQELEDGCYNLMGVGTQRFRIQRTHRGRPYLSGVVTLFDDVVEPEDELSTSVQQVRSLFGAYLNMLLDAPDEREVHTNLPEEPEDLSHFIAYFMEVDDTRKQSFLELTSTGQRLQEEINILRREVPFMRQLLFKKPNDDLSMLN